MVIVRVHMLKGRTADQKHRLISEVTAAITQELAVPAGEVRVLLVEIDPDGWGMAGVPASRLRKA